MARMIWPLLAAMLLFTSPDRAEAQDYPSGPIRMLTGFAPGGTADIVARELGAELEKAWRQSVVVENRTGANGAIATQQLARMAPDGHNLMTIVSGHITNPLVSPSAGYDAIKDFTPICLVASSPLLIFAHPSFPANNMKEALDLARAKPGTISFATPGVGSIQQLSMELVAYRSGTKFIHVPYRGGAPAVNDVVAGHVPISVNSVFQALPLIQSKALKPLAVTALKRSDVLPDVPTVAEAGVADYDATLLFGVIGPAGIPPAVVAKLNAEIVRIINTPQMREKFAKQGVLPIASTPAEFTATMLTEQKKWAEVIKAANIKE
jgi:tripartite-type tricarboxylate transporter receptor subunit TctC